MASQLTVRKLPLEGAMLITPFFAEDERGSFYKLFTKEALSQAGAKSDFSEEFVSVSHKGVIRGFHYQRSAHCQSRLIWVPQGEVFDVIVDLRQNSKTFSKWTSVRLSGKEKTMLYVPVGFAHAFQSLEDNTQMAYKADRPYSPENERGIIYSDLLLSIPWPIAKPIVSKKDLLWPTFEECEKF